MTAEALRLVFVFLFGSLLGSFLNVCIYRLPRDRSVFSPARSYCPICHQRIAWFDNVPILSWLLLGGCCRHCGTLISSRYAIVEALTASLFTLVYAILVQRGETWGVIAAYEALLAVLIAS
ncbi:MAG TPA: prepilin peptidase, partial [Candidatus Brocadiia bacterium]|nr:prepilin peptidase [Candidatus Brocadiia bacterium]